MAAAPPPLGDHAHRASHAALWAARVSPRTIQGCTRIVAIADGRLAGEDPLTLGRAVNALIVPIHNRTASPSADPFDFAVQTRPGRASVSVKFASTDVPAAARRSPASSARL